MRKSDNVTEGWHLVFRDLFPLIERTKNSKHTLTIRFRDFLGVNPNFFHTEVRGPHERFQQIDLRIGGCNHLHDYPFQHGLV